MSLVKLIRGELGLKGRIFNDKIKGGRSIKLARVPTLSIAEVNNLASKIGKAYPGAKIEYVPQAEQVVTFASYAYTGVRLHIRGI